MSFVKRILSLILAVVLVIGLLPVTARAGALDNGLVYEVCEDHVHVHEYIVTVVEPTCLKKGYTLYDCAFCLYSYKTDHVAPLGHDFADGFCSRCSKSAPDADSFDPVNGMYSPDDALTRGMFCYALWNYCGSPEPSSLNPCVDLKESDYYYDAVLWAMENRIVNSISATEFGPDDPVNRAQAATYLWRSIDPPEVPVDNPFIDVPDGTYFYQPVLWAYAAGCMGPKDAEDTFKPTDTCLYGHIYWGPGDHTHEYTATVTEPTCTEEGYTTYICACGDYYVADYVDALGHDFVDGFCTHCGNGNFAPEDELTRGMFFYTLWNYCGSVAPTSAKYHFTDVSESDYYYEAVYWAVENGITTGATATKFDPDSFMNRAQAAVYLWRAAGSPDAPTRNPFVDVGNLDFFYIPALWAAAEGCMDPLESNRFGPYEKCLYGHINWNFQIHTHKYTVTVTDPTCTRWGYTKYTCPCGYSYLDNHVDALGHDYAEGVCTRCGEADPEVIPDPIDPANGMFAPDEVMTRGTFFYALWNYFGSPEPISTENPFTDISESDYYYNAALWAVENGITTGTSATQFGPDWNMARLQAAVFLWRAFGSPEAPTENPFTDIKEGDLYYEAVLWVCAEGYMSHSDDTSMGYWDTTRFDTHKPCLYGHINWVPTNHPHQYTDVITVPCCTEGGYTTYTCELCGYSYQAKYEDALGHTFVDGTCISCGEADPDYEAPVEPPFADVPAGAYYEAPVLWAVENGITSGATENSFNPGGACLRAHVVTFLWRAAKQPEPAISTSAFTDVRSSDFFFKPVLWAVEQKITSGVSATEFGSYANCNRAAVVTFLWRAAGSPEPRTNRNPFTDVKKTDFFYKPVLWAVENNITAGLTATTFGPTAECNRAQVVTFLYRAYN